MTSPKPFCWVDKANWVLYDDVEKTEMEYCDESDAITLTPLFTLAQLEAYGEEARKEALEEMPHNIEHAAILAEQIGGCDLVKTRMDVPGVATPLDHWPNCKRCRIVAEIRALARKEEA